MKKLILVVVAVTLSFGVPAFHGEVVFKNSDGSTFKGHIKGDEYLNWVEDKQKNIIKYNAKSKDYEFAKVLKENEVVKLVPSHIKADGVIKSPFKVEKSKLKKMWKKNKKESFR